MLRPFGNPLYCLLALDGKTKKALSTTFIIFFLLANSKPLLKANNKTTVIVPQAMQKIARNERNLRVSISEHICLTKMVI
jgi:hypothetical protein